MRSPLKAIGVFSIVTTTMVPSGLLAQAYLSDATVCRRAINSDRSGWVEGFYAEEASRRGLAFRACDEMNNPPVRNETEENDETYNSPVTATREQREFLEAATYFITALDVDSGRGDVVSGTQIELGKYPIVICIGNSGCAVRLRTTTRPYTIWQFDFCEKLRTGGRQLGTATIQRRGSVDSLRFVSIEAGTGMKIIPATLALPIQDVA